MKTVYIEDNTPEGRWLLELIKDHKSVSFEPKKNVKAKNVDAWDKAIAEGAVSVDAFVGEVKRQLKEHYDNA